MLKKKKFLKNNKVKDKTNKGKIKKPGNIKKEKKNDE